MLRRARNDNSTSTFRDGDTRAGRQAAAPDVGISGPSLGQYSPVLLGRDPGTIAPMPYRAFDLQLNAAAVGISLPPELVKTAAKVLDH